MEPPFCADMAACVVSQLDLRHADHWKMPVTPDGTPLTTPLP